MRPALIDNPSYVGRWSRAWNQFWFSPMDGATLGVMRILVGAMVVYTHFAWTGDMQAFVSSTGALSPEYRSLLQPGTSFLWSHFDWSDSSVWMWTSHAIGLLIALMFTLGLWTRWTSILTFLLVVSYANRTIGTNFGLDQITAFLVLYLAVGDSGSAFSMDAWLRSRRNPNGAGHGRGATINRVATRLIQIHMCIVYLFAGLGKLQGELWWNGEALWGALASYEYQTLDMTGIAHMMWLVNILTFVSVAWEVSYPFLVWPKLSRPIVLFLAVAMHLGIGVCMGMITFGLIMIYGNLAFVSPEFFRNLRARFRAVPS